LETARLKALKIVNVENLTLSGINWYGWKAQIEERWDRQMDK